MAVGSSANTSATGGYLAPLSPPPATDTDLDAQLQQMVAGVTGLAGEYVRPRWQSTDDANDTGSVQPRVPSSTLTNWCAVGVLSFEQDPTPAFIHDGTGQGTTTLRRFDTIEVMASFYGVKGDGYAALLRDGLYVAQNREAMNRQGLTLIEAGTIRRVPEIVNTDNRRRADLTLRLRRRVERTYAILNVLQGVGLIVADADSADGRTLITTPFQTPEN